jgi:hypothetical protein
MYKFPLTVVDNFFTDPLGIRRLALNYPEYKTSDMYSGIRTENICKTHPLLGQHITDKIIDLYNIKAVDLRVSLHFHKTDSSYPGAWVHQDDVDLSAVIYLNPDSEDTLSFGTSLYRWNFSEERYDAKNMKSMRDSFKDPSLKDEVENNRIIANNCFVESVRVGERFNRLIAYDGRTPHAGQGYYGNNAQNNSRLVLLCFLDLVTKYGLTPMRKIRESRV